MTAKILFFFNKIISFFCTIMICYIFLQSITHQKRKILTAIIIGIIGIFFQIISPSATFSISILFHLSQIVICIFLFEPITKQKIFKILLVFASLRLWDTIIQNVIDIFLGNIFPIIHTLSSQISMILITIFLALSSRSKSFKIIRKCPVEMTKWQLAVIYFSIFFGTGLTTLCKIIQEMFGNDKNIWIFRFLVLSELFMVFLTTMFIAILYYQKEYYYEQNSLKDDLIDTLRDYYNILYKKDKEMRKFRHEVANQLGVLHILLQNNEIEKAQELLFDIHQEYKKANFQKIHVGNDILDVILNTANQCAIKNNIKLEVLGTLNNQCDYNIYQLCSIFFNAINNGIEACKKQEDNSSITIRILEHNHTLFFSFENPGTQEMYDSILARKTTKDDENNHGLGIDIIDHTVKQLNGTYEYRYENGHIILDIYI